MQWTLQSMLMSVDDRLVAYGMLLDIIWFLYSVTSCHAKGTSVFVTKTLR